MEASIAAPFTSKTPDISSIVVLFKEGRASLATSFAAFKYIEIYSMIMFTTTILLYMLACMIGDMQYVFFDVIIIVPFSIMMGYSKANPTLSKELPAGNLLSISVLASVIGQVIIMILWQIIVYVSLRLQSWYREFNYQGIDAAKGQENTVLFFFTMFQYIFSVITFTIGGSFRMPIYKNFII